MTSQIQHGVPEHPKGAFVLNDNSAEDVARALIEGGQQKEPFHILNLDKVYSRIQHFRDMMPRVQIFYAMKANDDELLLKLAMALGLGFDCASPGEIYKMRQLNVNPMSLIYTMPTKTPDQMMYARKSAIKHTVFDTSYELKKLKEYWPDASLLIRIGVDGDSIYKLSEKFGSDFDTEAVNLLEEAASLGLNVVGVAFHVGSACSSADSHVLGLQRVKALFEHEERAGRKMKIVDIGGGFLSDRADRIDQVSKLINNTLEELFPDPSIQVIAEPGRYLCDSSTVLYCSISNVRKIRKNNKLFNKFHIDDGTFGTLRFTEPWHTVERFKRSSDKEDKELENAELEDAILWGPSCGSADRIMQDYVVRLPFCNAFDWLVFTSQGAYSFVHASRFSCLEMPLIRHVISFELWNKVKDSPVFKTDDFVQNPNISMPLPSTMPPVVKDNGVYESSAPTLII